MRTGLRDLAMCDASLLRPVGRYATDGTGTHNRLIHHFLRRGLNDCRFVPA